jgi:hypothetical protein
METLRRRCKELLAASCTLDGPERAASIEQYQDIVHKMNLFYKDNIHIRTCAV